jgi:hypothetical protein
VAFCVYDECRTDADCAAQHVCMPGGLYDEISQCIEALCRKNEDCSARPDGRCRLVRTGFKGTKSRIAACVYPDDVCDNNRGCEGGNQECVYDRERRAPKCREVQRKS